MSTDQLDPAGWMAPLLVLDVNDLVVEFRVRGRNKIRAVDHVTFSLRDRQIVGIVGESGSGKSTLGRTVAGFQRATAGDTRYLKGDALTSRTATYGFRDVQMIFQDASTALDPRYTVLRTLSEALEPRGRATWRFGHQNSRLLEKASTLLRQVNLNDSMLYKRAGKLSGGEKQRLAIARAIAAEPRILVCDEAVSALDVAIRSIVLSVISGLRADLGIAILFISHDIAVVAQLADWILVMHDGRIVEQGPAKEVIYDPKDDYTRRLISSVPTFEAL